MTLTKRRIGPYVDVLSGYPFDSSAFGDSGSLPLVRIRDVVRGESSTYYSGSVDERYIVRDGDILIGMDGEFNRARWRGGQALLNQRVCRVKSCSRELDDRYLFHMLPRALKQIEQVTSFVTVKHLSVKQIREIEIPVPSIAEQRRIAEILDKADALRAKRRAALAQLDTLTQSIFLDMFGDPVTNGKGWTRAALGDVATFVGGGTPSRDNPEFFTGSICWATSKDMHSEFLDDTEEHITEQAIKSSATKAVPAGTILVVVKSKVLARRLPVAVTRVETCFGQDLKGVEVGAGCEVSFVAASLRIGSPMLLKNARGINTEGLTLDHLRKFSLMLPPLKLQREFARRAESALRIKTTAMASLRHLDAAFASLQYRAFRGEL